MLRLAWRNVGRVPLRAALTVLAIAICLIVHVLLRSINATWTERTAQTPNNRVVTRHRIGWDYRMPIHYVDDVLKMPGIHRAMGGSWVELKHPVLQTQYFGATAVSAEAFAAMHSELAAPAADKAAFVANRRGIMVSDELAKTFGWKLGDHVHLRGTQYPHDWELDVSCIFHSNRYGFAQRSLWMHWEYYNESLPPEARDQINIISSEIFQPRDGARLAHAIDIHFDAGRDQTFTQEDQALSASMVGQQGALLDALNIVSLCVLGILALIVGNTIAMGVRERTAEYGVLRAIGFGPRRIALSVLGEACALGLLGGAVGFGLSFPLIEHPLSRYFESNLELPPLVVSRVTAALAFFSSGLLGAASAALPAYRASRLELVAALRHVG
jgi:putative ABC transport system permease protein